MGVVSISLFNPQVVALLKSEVNGDKKLDDYEFVTRGEWSIFVCHKPNFFFNHYVI